MTAAAELSGLFGLRESGVKMAAVVDSIHLDPMLDEISEILHRITTSKDEVAAWHARSAIEKLRQYEAEVQGK